MTIEKFEGDVKHRIKQSEDQFDMLRIKKYVSEFYKSNNDIPRIIAPTENGWQGPRFNRKLDPGVAEIIVTAENAKPLRIPLTILNDQDKKHGIIRIKNSD